MHSITDVIHVIHSAGRIALSTHIRPDGDAIGSVLGMCRILSGAGKRVTLVGIDPVPQRYAFLMGSDTIIPASEVSPEDYDLLVLLDTGALDRAPDSLASWMPRVRTLNMDHHPTNTGFADINYVVSGASSVGEMVVDLAIAAGYGIPRDAAEALWVAMATDTGRFSYSNTTPAALRAAASLLETGIRADELNHRVYESTTASQIRLQGRAIEHLTLHHDGRVAVVSLSREDFESLECTGEDADEIVSIPRRVAGVDVAVFLYELPGKGPRATKAGLRSREPYDAAGLCAQLGGGGHARAAGCSLDMPLDEAKACILDRISSLWFSA